MRGDSDNLSSMVQRVQQWLVTKRWRKAIYGAICVQKCELMKPKTSLSWQPLYSPHLVHSDKEDIVQEQECYSGTGISPTVSSHE